MKLLSAVHYTGQNLSYMSACVFSVVSDSFRPHGPWPTRRLCPWNFPGKNTGVGCHFLLQGNFLTQRSNTCISCVSCIAGGFFTTWAIGKAWICLDLPAAAAAAVKSLQSCPTLCNPIDGSPPGSPVPGILQARTLEWAAISFSNAWKWKVKVKSFSRVQLLATPWTAAYQASPSMGFSRQEYWSGLPLTYLQNIAKGMSFVYNDSMAQIGYWC